MFGGTWSRITDGYLFCGATGYGKGTQSNLLNATRTADTTLTIDQIPSHRHDLGYRVGGGGGNTWYLDPGTIEGWSGSSNTAIGYTGGGQGHSHPMPTTAVSVWKRTA